MGSIDIPPFLREKMKAKIQNDSEETSIEIPDFLKKKENPDLSGKRPASYPLPDVSSGASSPTVSTSNTFDPNTFMRQSRAALLADNKPVQDNIKPQIVIPDKITNQRTVALQQSVVAQQKATPVINPVTHPLAASGERTSQTPEDNFNATDFLTGQIKSAYPDIDPNEILSHKSTLEQFTQNKVTDIDKQLDVLKHQQIEENAISSPANSDISQSVKLPSVKPIIPDDQKTTNTQQKIDALQVEKEKYQKSINYFGSIHAGLESGGNPEKAGLLLRQFTGDKQAYDDERLQGEGYGNPQTEYSNAKIGLQALNTTLDAQYANDPANPEYVQQKQALQKQNATLLDKYPEVKSKQIESLIGGWFYKDTPQWEIVTGTADKPTNEDIKKLAKEHGLSDADVNNIDADMIPAPQSFASGVVGGLYKGFLGLGASIARVGGSAVGIDKDWLDYHLNDAQQQAENRFAQPESYQLQKAPTVIDQDKNSPTYLQNIPNPNAGKYNYTGATISNGLGQGIGGLAYFILANKAWSGVIGKIAPELQTTIEGQKTIHDMSMMGTMFGGYEGHYQQARQIIGDSPDDEAKRHLLALAGVYFDKKVFDFVPTEKLSNALFNDAKSEAITSIGENINKLPSDLKGMDKSLLVPYLKTAAKIVLDATGETAKINTVATAGIIANHIAGSIVGFNNDESKKAWNETPEEIKNTWTNSVFNMLIPIGLADVVNAKSPSKLRNEAIYDAALHPKTYKGNLAKMVNSGAMSSEQAQGKSDIIDAAAQMVKAVPQTNPETGQALSHSQSVKWLNNRLQETALEAKKTGVKDDKVLGKFYDTKIKGLQAERETMLKQPEAVPVNEQKTNISSPINTNNEIKTKDAILPEGQGQKVESQTGAENNGPVIKGDVVQYTPNNRLSPEHSAFETDLNNINYLSKEQLETKLNEYLDQKRSNGELTEAEYKGFKGEKFGPDSGRNTTVENQQAKQPEGRSGGTYVGRQPGQSQQQELRPKSQIQSQVEPSKISDLTDSDVMFNGERGRLKTDEENNVVFDNGAKETLMGKTTDEKFNNSNAADHGITEVPKVEVEGDNVKIDGEGFTLNHDKEGGAFGFDKDGNAVSVNLKNEKGQPITKRDKGLALDIAIAKNNNDFESRPEPKDYENGTSQPVKNIFKEEHGQKADDIINSMPDEVVVQAKQEQAWREQFEQQYKDEIAAEEKEMADRANDEKEYQTSPEALQHLINQYEAETNTHDAGRNKPGSKSAGVTSSGSEQDNAAEGGDIRGLPKDKQETDSGQQQSDKGGQLSEGNMGKVAFARTNSYSVFKTIHPEISIDGYNKLRSSDIQIPNSELRELGKKHIKDHPASESAATEKFYDEIAGSKPVNTGRIPVSPIIGESKDLSKILFDVSKALKQKVFFLKPGDRAAGTYSPGSGAIKIKFTGDLDVTAHEIGHSMDDHFNVLKDLRDSPNPTIEIELAKFSPFGSKPPKGYPDPKLYIRAEGFAEWLRAFIVNPNEAINAAPELYKLYEDKVAADYKKALSNFSTDVRTWAGSTGRDMVLSNIQWEPEKAKGLIKKVFSKSNSDDMFTISWADKIAANFVNPMRAFEKAFNYARGIKGIDHVLPKNDPTILARLFLSIDRKFGEFLEHGLRDSKDELIPIKGSVVLKDENGNILKNGEGKTFKWLIEPLDNTDMSTIKKEMQEVTSYMIAERTVELGNKFSRESILTGIGGGIYRDVDVALKALNEFHNGDPKKLERIKEAAKRYREFSDDILRYMVDKGRLSETVYHEIKTHNMHYVALHRIMEAEPETEIQIFTEGGKKLSSVNQPIKNIKGSTRKIVNPYISLLDSMYKSIKESDRNDVLRAFRDMVQNNRSMYDGAVKRLSEIGVIAKPGDKNTITVFIKGKPEKWAIQKDIYEALKGLDNDGYKLPGFLTLHTKILRNMTVKFPTFAVRNWVRDFQDRLIKSNDHSGVKDLFGNKEHWRDVARKGGLNAGYYVRDKVHYYGLMEQAMDEISKNQKTIFADPIKIKRLWYGYENILQASETSNRVAEYRAAFRQAKLKGMDDYNAGLYGAFKSRDLMDFAVAGHYMKIINQLVPFSNAAIQGIRSSVVRAQENPARFLSRMAIYSVLPQAALWWWNHRDEETAKEYENLPSYQRDMFSNIKIGDNKWLSIPKPYELGMTGAGVDRGLSLMYGYNDKGYSGYAGSVFQALSPIDQSSMVAPFQPIIEATVNYDLFRGKNIITPRENALNLALRHTETASWLSQQIQKAAGIDARKIDYIIRSQFSYVGNEGLKAIDKLAEVSGAKGPNNHNDFDIADLGIFKRSPAYNSVAVQDMMAFAKEWGLDRSKDYKEFQNLAGKYFDATTNQEKEDYANQLIDLSKLLLANWKASGVEDKVKAKAEKKKY